MEARRSLRLRSKLAEQIAELSNPKPASFHPDLEFLEDHTAAKVCDFTYEADGDDLTRSEMRSKPSRMGMEFDEPKYAGKVVTRKELEAEVEGEGSLEMFANFVHKYKGFSSLRGHLQIFFTALIELLIN